ncbi:hypothetical protein E1B28_008946 [Marasmius oreades]|uniref:Cupredoxin n=1 Tax=Marasmius oreades TaxID=181124 RepID=A0A9P7RZZ4_9AGAR|nr:uncharacterized protein E1B28_008946 [Marasmius oreades]KAG7092603.1 hypothetical protein E1B28_008946 [Marasmius oreades]
MVADGSLVPLYKLHNPSFVSLRYIVEMRFSTLAVALLPAAALAAVQTVTVGDQNKLEFSPPSVNAALGDTIQFQFKSKNHSVTQSTFDSPCVFKAAGVDSGFQATPPGATPSASWSFMLNTTDALWFFCAQTAPANHCANGMVFAINPPPDKTFDMFKANAMSQGSAPGGNTTASGSSSSGAAAPTGATGTGGSPTAGATGATSASSSVTSATTSGTADASKSNAASVMNANGVALLSMAGLVLGLIL